MSSVSSKNKTESFPVEPLKKKLKTSGVFNPDNEISKTKTGEVRDNKIVAIAKLNLEAFVKFCYDDQGNLNNRIALKQSWNGFWGTCRKKDELPEGMKMKAAELRNAGGEKNLSLAKELEGNAKKMEEERQEWFDTEAKKTFFPIQVDYRSYEVDKIIRPLKKGELKQTEFYHGTDPVSARSITELGFSSAYYSPRELDSGFGAYFSIYKDSALEKYAKGKDEGLLTCEFPTWDQWINEGKVGYLTTSSFYHMVVMPFSWNMATEFIRENEEKIKEQFTAKDIPITKVYSSFENEDDVVKVRRQLTNEITRVFFQKLGYEALYVPGSDWAGISYVNILNPTKENINIKE